MLLSYCRPDNRVNLTEVASASRSAEGRAPGSRSRRSNGRQDRLRHASRLSGGACNPPTAASLRMSTNSGASRSRLCEVRQQLILRLGANTGECR